MFDTARLGCRSGAAQDGGLSPSARSARRFDQRSTLGEAGRVGSASRALGDRALLERYERSGQLPSRTLASFEVLATDLMRSFAGNDEPPLERIIEHFRIRRPLTWDRPPSTEITARLRRFIREQLQASVDAVRTPISWTSLTLESSSREQRDSRTGLISQVRGRTNVKVEPTPSELSTAMSPPIARAS